MTGRGSRTTWMAPQIPHIALRLFLPLRNRPRPLGQSQPARMAVTELLASRKPLTSAPCFEQPPEFVRTAGRVQLQPFGSAAKGASDRQCAHGVRVEAQAARPRPAANRPENHLIVRIDHVDAEFVVAVDPP